MKLGNKEREHQSLLSETNNNEEKSESIKLKSLDLVQGKINNTERGKPCLQLSQIKTVKQGWNSSQASTKQDSQLSFCCLCNDMTWDDVTVCCLDDILKWILYYRRLDILFIFPAKLLEVASQTPTAKDDNAKTSPPVMQSDLNPPIITHTAATPMPTPQGSPNDHGPKECNKVTLCVHPPVEMSTLSVRSSSVSLLR